MTAPTPDDLVGTLARMPMFERLSGDQLEWLAERGEVITRPAGTVLFQVGDVGVDFYLLIDGEIELLQPIGSDELPAVRSSRLGAWAGSVPEVEGEARITARLTADSVLFRVPSPVMADMLLTGFPIAKHLLIGLQAGTREFEARVHERERLAALGKLSAGVAHELNNPSAAAQRAAARLVPALLGAQSALLEMLAPQRSAELRPVLESIQQEVVERTATTVPLSPLDRADREDDVSEWLDRFGVDDASAIASTIVDAGLDVAWLENVMERTADLDAAAVLHWLRASTAIVQLVNAVNDTTGRISELVKAIKSYTYMDQALQQEVDVHAGLESTVAMLGHKLGDIEIVRDYATDLPKITANGGELNQVWTNLIDNAIDALDALEGRSDTAGSPGRGRITLRTRRDGDQVVVEVADNGPGIPEDVVYRVFEPFFTTKPVGDGTGLGLDIVYRIVNGNHQGQISVTSEPGNTCFRVALPIAGPRT